VRQRLRRNLIFSNNPFMRYTYKGIIVFAAWPGTDNRKPKLIAWHLAAIILPIISNHPFLSINPTLANRRQFRSRNSSRNSRTPSNNSSGSAKLQSTSPVLIRPNSQKYDGAKWGL
jgi:hypothetical protein